jgi:hypothetical protein
MAMRTEDAFPLEAEISLTDLREETSLPVALERFHRLVLRRYGKIMGVVLDQPEWFRLTSRIADLESQVEALEDAALRELVRSRAADADPQPGHPGRYATIFEEAEASAAAQSTH